MKSPKIYLAVDNCFAYKRWTRPREWIALSHRAGLRCVEASADTELDPCYMGTEYLKKWTKEVRAAQEEYGVRVVNLYSGHGSYITLGLAHPERSVREHMMENWFKPMIDAAAELSAGFGFFAHGFCQSVLEDPKAYRASMDILLDNFETLGVYAKKAGCGKIGVEQMYSPHQVPWRIQETRQMLRELARRGVDFYFTEDVGHHHDKFLMPGRGQLAQALERGQTKGLWLGTERAYEYYNEALAVKEKRNNLTDRIIDDMQAHAYLFAEKEDADCYEWLRQLGAYAPIVHLQQTNGRESAHRFFTEENNEAGVIKIPKLLRAIQRSYREKEEPGMPPRCEEIYLTIEGFLGTACLPQDGLADLAETVRCLRKAVPEDGMELDQLLEDKNE